MKWPRLINGMKETMESTSCSKSKRRPEREIYRPGMGLNNKPKPKSGPDIQDKGDQQAQPDEASTKYSLDVLSNNNNTKLKKPDLQVYVPKPKTQVILTESHPNEDHSRPKSSRRRSPKNGASKCKKECSSSNPNPSKTLPHVIKVDTNAPPKSESISSKQDHPSAANHVKYDDCIYSKDVTKPHHTNPRTKRASKPKFENTNRPTAQSQSTPVQKPASLPKQSQSATFHDKSDNRRTSETQRRRVNKVSRSNSTESELSIKSAEEKNFFSSERKILDWSEEVEISERENLKAASLRENVPQLFLDSNKEAAGSGRKAKNNSRRERYKKRRSSSPKNIRQVEQTKQQQPKSTKSESETYNSPHKFDRKLPLHETNSRGSGGILKLPHRIEELEENVNPSYPFSGSPPVTTATSCVVQKQLYDPNNPSKPLIVYQSQPTPPKQTHGFSPIESYGMNIRAPSMGGLVRPPYGYDLPMYNYNAPVSMNACYPDSYYGTESKRPPKPIVIKNLQEIEILEQEMSGYMDKKIFDIGGSEMGQCRWKLQLRYENIILADPRYCAEVNVEQNLWKSAFYQQIEKYRFIMEEQPRNKEKAQKALIQHVDEAIVFFENLLVKLQETYGVDIEAFMEAPFEYTKTHGIIRLLLPGIQRIFLYLGDLARYREMANDTINFGKARNYYLQAQKVLPKHGRPYYQLGLLALYTKRKMDAIYYFIRSLAASNSFKTARENLLTLFEDTRKKFELEEQRKEDEFISTRKAEAPHPEKKIEVWIREDGVKSSNLSPKKEVDKIARMDIHQLTKLFTNCFLHVHGKLFTKVGMETFAEAVNQMLMLFTHLLERTPLPITSNHLLQFFSINMFSILNTSPKEASLDPKCRSFLQEQALDVFFDMVTILMKRTLQLLEDHLKADAYPDQIVSKDLSQLLPPLKVWTDWMACQVHMWTPPPTPTSFETGCKEDIWSMFARLVTLTRNAKLIDVELSKLPTKGFVHIPLPEDETVACFGPLMGAPEVTFFVEESEDKDRALHCSRFNRLEFFADYLCGIPTPYLNFDIQRREYVSVIPTPSYDEPAPPKKQSLSDPPKDEDTLETADLALDSKWELELPANEPKSDADSLDHLFWKKEQLSRNARKQEQKAASAEAELQKCERPILLEIRPKYLVPDTNCFIDHLTVVHTLITAKRYILVVPLVVINELDGLALGNQQESPSDHSQKVADQAQHAISYLEERFASRDSKIRSITAKGSVLTTITFRSEDMSDSKGSNDDLILACCLHYCKGDRPENYMPKDPSAPLKLAREVVLLTEDRNLSVKALLHNVPVKSLISFIHWADL